MFTAIHKFMPEKGEAMPELSARQNIVVIADEAHRSQYGFGGKVNEKTGEMSYGFASNLRDALPNASFIGLTPSLPPPGRASPNALRCLFAALRAPFGQPAAGYLRLRLRFSCPTWLLRFQARSERCRADLAGEEERILREHQRDRAARLPALLRPRGEPGRPGDGCVSEEEV